MQSVAIDPVVAVNEAIKLDEFEYGVTSVRRTNECRVGLFDIQRMAWFPLTGRFDTTDSMLFYIRPLDICARHSDSNL